MQENAVERQQRVDAFLTMMSWDRTWSAMDNLVKQAIERRQARLGGRAERAA